MILSTTPKNFCPPGTFDGIKQNVCIKVLNIGIIMTDRLSIVIIRQLKYKKAEVNIGRHLSVQKSQNSRKFIYCIHDHRNSIYIK